MLNIFTYKSCVTVENEKRLFPLLRDLFFWEKSVLRNYFTTVDKIEKADIVIIPLDVNFFFEKKQEKKLFQLIEEGRRYRKPIWIYSSGDIGKTIKAPVYTFRLGGFNSKLDKKTFIIPAFIKDPYETFLKRKFEPIEKEKKPSIGFVGHANGSLVKWIKELIIFLFSNFKRIKGNFSYDFQPFFASGNFRFRLLARLAKDKRISTSFIFRRKYRAGAKTPEEKKITTLEFYENIEKNGYTLCVRGVGNFSIRLYEVLAMGRIPVLIKSDFRLPLPWLDWKKHCIITDRENLSEAVLAFHNSNSLEEFHKIQTENKKLWEDKLTWEGFFKEIHDHFSHMSNEV